jgi:hypothetical protein
MPWNKKEKGDKKMKTKVNEETQTDSTYDEALKFLRKLFETLGDTGL